MADGRDDGPEERGGSSGLGTAAEYSVIGFVFPLALVIGFFVGRWVGSLLGGPTVGIVVGVLLGAVAGFWNLYSSLQRIERREAARKEAAGTERGEGPGPEQGG